jgi:hypothetical protein
MQLIVCSRMKFILLALWSPTDRLQRAAKSLSTRDILCDARDLVNYQIRFGRAKPLDVQESSNSLFLSASYHRLQIDWRSRGTRIMD